MFSTFQRPRLAARSWRKEDFARFDSRTKEKYFHLRFQLSLKYTLITLKRWEANSTNVSPCLLRLLEMVHQDKIREKLPAAFRALIRKMYRLANFSGRVLWPRCRGVLRREDTFIVWRDFEYVYSLHKVSSSPARFVVLLWNFRRETNL